METEIIIAADDPVRLVSAVVERMDIRKIERSYSQDGRNEYPPRILLKVMIYAYMRLIYSSREIRRTLFSPSLIKVTAPGENNLWVPYGQKTD